MNRHILVSALTAIGLIALTACSVLAPRPDPWKFFVLAPLAAGQGGSPAAGAARPAIGLGPITLPDYLDRPEIVRRIDSNRMEMSRADRWAEPLPDAFKRVLAENLSTLLWTRQIVPYPWYNSTHLDYEIGVHVYRFEADTSDGAQLTAHWNVRDGRTGKMLISRDSALHEAAGSGATGAAVAALSNALSELSRQIADTVLLLQQRHGDVSG